MLCNLFDYWIPSPRRRLRRRRRSHMMPVIAQAQPFAVPGAPLPVSSSPGHPLVPIPVPHSGHRSRAHSQTGVRGHHRSSSKDNSQHDHLSRDEYHSPLPSIPPNPLDKGETGRGQRQSQRRSQLQSNVLSLAQEAPRQRRDELTLPVFQYTSCVSRKKAVCIGINYAGTSHELRGCVNDATCMYRFLDDRYGYKKENMLYLVDTCHDPRAQPTKAHILQAMKWLVEDAHEGDSFFFHFSGHGSLQEDPEGDEADGLDGVIFPLDYEEEGVITDDEMHDILVQSLPSGCRLTATFDTCHSGSMLDLPYLYGSRGRRNKSDVAHEWRERRTSLADVVMYSGSTDAQTSAETVRNGIPLGAMSRAFRKALERNSYISYQDLLGHIRNRLKARYNQTPQLSCSHYIDPRLRIIL